MWSWRIELPANASDAATGSDSDVPAFPARGDAETWLGEVWRDLAEQGIARVQLTLDGADVGEPLPLIAHAPGSEDRERVSEES